MIKAFKKVSGEFPEYCLKIVGYCPDRNPYEQLAGANAKIRLCGPVRYEEVIKLMAECSLFILPSRTEAMGSVLLEAMASKKPIIASNVDGIPTYIKHGYNGLLFQSENVDDLAAKMRSVLKDGDFAGQLGTNAFKYVHEKLSEQCYMERFDHMVSTLFS